MRPAGGRLPDCCPLEGSCSSLCASADPAARAETTRSLSAFTSQRGKGERRGEADAEADMPLAEAWGAICVQRFDGSHNLQFTLRIAFRCVLHRYGNQDIRC